MYWVSSEFFFNDVFSFLVIKLLDWKSVPKMLCRKLTELKLDLSCFLFSYIVYLYLILINQQINKIIKYKICTYLINEFLYQY